MIKVKEFYKKNKKLLVLILTISLFGIFVVHSFLHFRSDFTKNEIEKTKAEIERTAKIKMDSIYRRYENMLNILEEVSNHMVIFDETNYHLIIDTLDFSRNISDFTHVGVADPQGNILDSDGRSGNIKERDYFKRAIKGENNISEVLESTVLSQENVQIMAVPIIKDKEITGITYGVINIGEIDKLLENETASFIYTQLVDSNGNYITMEHPTDALATNENIWDEFERYQFIDSSIENIKQDVENKKSGMFSFEYKGETRISYYMPLGINNYYLFSTSSNSLIDLRTKDLSYNTFFLLTEVIIAGIILFIGIFYYIRQLNKTLKRNYQEAISTGEMLKIGAQESQQYIFEYNAKTKTLTKKAGIHNLLFSKDEFLDIPHSIISMNILEGETINDFAGIFEEIQSKDFVEKEIELKNNGVPQWLRIKMKNVYNEHKIVNTIGIVDDITEKKKQDRLIKQRDQESIVLKHQAERDALTNLYNGGAFKQKIAYILSQEIEENHEHLFLLIDLDNFKLINDTFGHQYGDNVLIEMANTIQHSFRKYDIIARLGGDEFVAFLVDTAGYEIMEPILANLCKKLTKTYTKDGIQVTVSASIGIATAPNHGTTFKDLYYKSDIALYQVKNSSKNGYKKFAD